MNQSCLSGDSSPPASLSSPNAQIDIVVRQRKRFIEPAQGVPLLSVDQQARRAHRWHHTVVSQLRLVGGAMPMHMHPLPVRVRVKPRMLDAAIGIDQRRPHRANPRQRRHPQHRLQPVGVQCLDIIVEEQEPFPTRLACPEVTEPSEVERLVAAHHPMPRPLQVPAKTRLATAVVHQDGVTPPPCPPQAPQTRTQQCILIAKRDDHAHPAGRQGVRAQRFLTGERPRPLPPATKPSPPRAAGELLGQQLRPLPLVKVALI